MMINPAHNATLCNASYKSGDHAGASEFAGRQSVITGGGWFQLDWIVEFNSSQGPELS